MNAIRLYSDSVRRRYIEEQSQLLYYKLVLVIKNNIYLIIIITFIITSYLGRFLSWLYINQYRFRLIKNKYF